MTPSITTRHCGGCTLCCRLVPVEVLHKSANTKCRHQSRRGCAIHQRLPDLVPECHLWSCQWLVDPDAGALRRPDRSHYVVDIMPDFVGVHDPDGTGADETIDLPVMQVWADPDHPDAWEHDPAVRRYMEHVAATRRQATLVRWANDRAVVIFPPALMRDGQWHRKECNPSPPGSSWVNPLDMVRARAGLERQARGYAYDPARDLARAVAE